MRRSLVLPALFAGLIYMVPNTGVLAAEVNLKAGYFISNKKSLTR